VLSLVDEKFIHKVSVNNPLYTTCGRGDDLSSTDSRFFCCLAGNMELLELQRKFEEEDIDEDFSDAG
jgi:hypothetical protein